MTAFYYTVIVECENEEQADQVIAERISHDEDYGFGYTLTYENGCESAYRSLRLENTVEDIKAVADYLRVEITDEQALAIAKDYLRSHDQTIDNWTQMQEAVEYYFEEVD